MRLSKLALLLLAPALLIGCSKDNIVATVEPLCASITHVCVSREDRLTEGTAQMIEGNNLARQAVCKPKGDPCQEVRARPAPKASPKPAAPKVAQAS